MKTGKEYLIQDLESIKTEGVISGRENQEIDRLNMGIDWIIELVKEGEYE